ncbi:hypothetical protein E6H26_05305, partial [Candidatus Bathyarchaeota archaeon]
MQRAKTMTGIIESIEAARRELKQRLEESASLAKEQAQVQASVKDLVGRVDELSGKSDLHE